VIEGKANDRAMHVAPDIGKSCIHEPCVSLISKKGRKMIKIYFRDLLSLLLNHCVYIKRDQTWHCCWRSLFINQKVRVVTAH